MVFAIANQKGGVGKTTTAINVAACLAEAGERALIVDLDPQANATSGLGERANGTSSYDLLDGAALEGLARPTRFPNLDLVPVQAEYYALEGLTQLVHSVNLVRARLNPKLALGGLLLTMVDGRTRLAAGALAAGPGPLRPPLFRNTGSPPP